MTLDILYIVPEDPEKPHVAEQVPDRTVKKQRSHESNVRAEKYLRIYIHCMGNLERNHPVACNYVIPVPAHPELDEMNETVRGNKKNRHIWKFFSGVFVLQRKKHTPL